MKIVADTNVLFTFFWKGAAIWGIVYKNVELYSPETALGEIDGHEEEIMKKAKLSKKEYTDIRRQLEGWVEFIPIEGYRECLKNAAGLASGLAEKEREEMLDDADFLALSIKLDCPLWTNDSLLRKQHQVIVFSTKEMISLVEYDEGTALSAYYGENKK